MISTCAPSLCQNVRSASTAASGASSAGVKMHHRPLKSVAKPASGPLFSVPATGWAGMMVAFGSTAASASTTLCLHDPTSLTTAPMGRSVANSSATAPIAPTGTHKITRSASITAVPTVSVISSQIPKASARARTSASASNPVIRTAGIFARTARATDEPIRPRPITVRRAKGSITHQTPGWCALPVSPRGSLPRSRW